MSLELPQGSQVSCHELLPQLPSVCSQLLDIIEGQMGGCARIYAIFILVIWTAFTSFNLLLSRRHDSWLWKPDTGPSSGSWPQACAAVMFTDGISITLLTPSSTVTTILTGRSCIYSIFQKVKGSSGLPSIESVRTASSPRQDRQRSKWLQMWIKETCDNLRISWYIVLVCW